MNTTTEDVTSLAVRVAAPRGEVFNFLANVENVPRWAEEFCERLEVSRGRWLALTAAGELFVELQADERSGVIDVRCGEEDCVFAHFSLRVLHAPTGDCVVSLLCCRAPGESRDRFAQRSAMVAEGLSRLRERWTPKAVAQVA